MPLITFCAYDKPDNVGGPVSWLQRLAPMLVERGFEVNCLFIMHWGDTGPAVASLRAAGIHCEIATGIDRTEDRVSWILDRVRENPPDVFVPNLVIAAYFAGRWIREAGIPTVGILHSDDPFYRGILDEFVSGGDAFRVSSVVCVSAELASQVAQRSSAGVEVRQIPYGVTVPARRVERQEGRLRLAYVGRLAEQQKRIGDTTRALCAAASRVDGVEATLYGDGPDRDVVERILDTDGAGLPVRLAGLVDSAGIQASMLESDSIVLLSDYEGLPIALLEAMACGCVPIALRMRSGIPELVDHESTGLLVEDRGESFVHAVRRLREDAGLWQALSERARARVAESFSSEASAEAWARLFIDLANVNRSRRVIPVPSRLDLPPVNPALASADVRAPAVPFSARVYRQTRMVLGRVKKQLFRQ